MKTQRRNGERLPRRFHTLLTEEVIEFLKTLDLKDKQKILSNIRKAEVVADPELFKKLTEDIWEFRTLYNRKHYRLLAFGDRREEVVVIATHGFIKKSSKIPIKELERAINIRNEYLMLKTK